MNEEQIENRFREFREKSSEELEAELERLSKELEGLEEVHDTTSNYNERNELWSDIKFDEEQISFIEKVLHERNKTR